MIRFLSLALVGMTCLALSAPLLALTPEQSRALTQGDVDSRVTAIQQVLVAPDDKLLLFCRPWQMMLSKSMDPKFF